MDTQRLILFFVFSFSLLMLWEAWQKETRPVPPGVTATAPAAVPTPSAPPSAGTLPTPQASGAPGVPQVAQAGGPRVGERLRVKTDTVIAEIDTQGGDIAYLELLQHKDTLDRTRNLVLFGPEHQYAAQSGLIGANLPNHKTVFTAGAKEFSLAPGQDKLEVSLRADTPEGVQVTKTLIFHRGSYRIDVAHRIENKSAAPLAAHAYYQLTRDGKAPAGDSSMAHTYTGAAVYTDQEKYQKVSFEDIDKSKSPYPKTADNGWIAMVQHYFVSAWLPQDKQPREFYTRKLGEQLYAAGVIVPLGSLAPGAAADTVLPLYAGPQEQDNLKAIAPGLELVVDYGWLTIIAAPLFWVLKMFHNWVGNWGVAIILLTVVIKLVFYPLSAASYKSMARMKLVTPKLVRLREQYADDRMKMNQAMMELYKTEKINPLGGCLPIVVQIPVFIALYWVLLASVELRQAPFYGWITDLSAQDPFYVLPALMMVSMVLQTKMNPVPPDPVQAKVMMFMPFIFGVMFFFFPAGLVLYWLVNNILSIAQQWQITRMVEGSKPAVAKR
jgi:YidC/Oxa1 family membrane protein insertase